MRSDTIIVHEFRRLAFAPPSGGFTPKGSLRVNLPAEFADRENPLGPVEHFEIALFGEDEDDIAGRDQGEFTKGSGSPSEGFAQHTDAAPDTLDRNPRVD